VPWQASALPWLEARFAGKSPPQDCSEIPADNPIE
jgi:hypothetical protein